MTGITRDRLTVPAGEDVRTFVGLMVARALVRARPGVLREVVRDELHRGAAGIRFDLTAAGHFGKREIDQLVGARMDCAVVGADLVLVVDADQATVLRRAGDRWTLEVVP